MRPELRNEMLRILEERFKGEMLPLHFGDEGLTFEAVYLLREYGALAQIHRRDDYAAAERAIGAREGDGPGTIWGRGGPVSVFSCRGETL